MSDERTCAICDGGPGNNCACSCGFRLYDQKPLEVAPPEHDRRDAAVRTLEHLKYTHLGGEYWRPPIGPKPDFEVMVLVDPGDPGYTYVFDEGKYRVTWTAGGGQQEAESDYSATRHGEPWRDLTGDNLIGSMLWEINRLQRLALDAGVPFSALRPPGAA